MPSRQSIAGRGMADYCNEPGFPRPVDGAWNIRSRSEAVVTPSHGDGARQEGSAEGTYAAKTNAVLGLRLMSRYAWDVFTSPWTAAPMRTLRVQEGTLL